MSTQLQPAGRVPWVRRRRVQRFATGQGRWKTRTPHGSPLAWTEPEHGRGYEGDQCTAPPLVALPQARARTARQAAIAALIALGVPAAPANNLWRRDRITEPFHHLRRPAPAGRSCEGRGG